MGIVSAYSILIILVFLIFFYSVKSKHQWKVLLLGSALYFALCSPVGFLLVVASALISYFCAKIISREEKLRKKKLILISEIVCFVLTWVIAKEFFATSGNKVFLFSTRKISETAITLGISYFVLRYISYSYDVYKNKISPEDNFFKLLLFYCYFPTILQGPIERYGFFKGTLFADGKIKLAYSNIKTAGTLILQGLVKIYVISRFCAIFTAYMNSAEGIPGLLLLLAIFLYPIQIFTDFSGGIDVVRGISFLFGVELSDNFRRPYLSQSFSEFWKRWHITFSSWLKDYIYIPLGGSRKGKVNGYLNLAIVFVVSGLWHGFGLTFLIWGGLQALYVLVERITGRDSVRNSSPESIPLVKYLLNSAKVFLLSTFSWIFFNADSLGSIKIMFVSIWASCKTLVHSGLTAVLVEFKELYGLEITLSPRAFCIYLALIFSAVILHILKDRKNFDLTDSAKVCSFVRWSYYIVMLSVLMTMGFYGNSFSLDSFIYGAF